MRLEEIGIQLRPRTASEALDLGRTMMQAWYGGAMRAWTLTYLAFGIPLLLVLWHHQEIAILVVWWLKPLSDRALLFAYSRSLFGETTTLRDVWRALPGLLRNTGLLTALTLRRLSLRRAFLLPVWQLEGQRGKPARQRCRVLSSRVDNLSVGLTVFCANISFFLGLSLLLLVQMFVPEGHQGLFRISEWMDGQIPAAMVFMLNLAYMTGETIVEPFYVASGFSLYLNRRSELEGWDIELAFRRMSSRKGAE
jgi:hypothetical protein